MFPILYKANETSFIHNGLGVLKDAISVKAIEELNGLFELEIEYDPEGFLIDEIDYEMIVKAKVNDKQEEQLFRIYSFDKSFQNDNILIHCQHITYDAAGNFVEELELNNVTTDVAMQTLQSKLAYPSKITFSSPNTTTRSSTKLYRTNPLQMVAGMDGSILDNWGGEIERDNFRLVMHARRGKDDGVLIAYKKNLTGLEAKFDMSNVVTRIFPFAIKDDVLITIPNKYIDSPNINAYEHIKIEPVDFSGDENITDSTSLYNASKNYFNTGGKDLPTVSMDVEFEPLWDTEEYKNLAVLELVGMGDTVTVRHTKMGIDVTAKVNRIEYDVIAQKNSAVGIGSVQAGLTDKVNKSTNMENAVKQALNVANQAIVSANGKNNTYFGPNEPVGSFLEGDLWFKLVDDDFTQTYRFDGIQWQLIVDMDVNAAKQEAAEASQRAEDAFNRANEATENAQKAIEDAQTSFDKAQDALDTASAVNSIAVDAVNVANTAKQNAQNALNKATSLETEVGSISDDLAEAGGKITTIEQNVDTINNSLTTTIRTLSNLDGVVSEQQTVITALDEKIELRATKTSVDTLTGRVSDTESNIKSMAGQISLMAKAEDVYTKAQVDSSLKGKVDTSTYTSKMSQIDLSINGITNRVSSTESNINTINSNIASLDIKADGIISSVSQVQTNLDNLEIGGRNLVTNTSKDFKSVTFSSWDYIFKDKVMDWEKGMLLTGRIYLKPTSQEASIMIHVRYEDNTYSQYRGNIIKAGEEGYSTVTITVPNKDIKIIEYGIRHSSSSTPSDTVRYKEAKVEKGNKATDWTPAPEDMVTIAQFSTIEQTVNGITTRVGTSEGNISSLQQTASSFATRISNAEGNISSISQTLSGVQTTVSNKADKSTVTQLATVVDTKISTTDANNKFATQSQLTQTSNSLTSKISSVQTNLDNLEIGGRNLVQNGNFQSSHGWRTFQNVVKIDVVNDSTFGKVLEATIDSSSSSRQPAVAHNPVSVNEGEIYTYSVWIKRTTAGNGIVGMLLKFRNSSGGESNPIGGVTTDLQQGKWYRLVQTFTVPVGMVSVYGTPRITTSTVSTKFQIANVKLEKGNKATDFTPAPEDMATASQFSQLSDAINLRVTKDDLMTQINLNPQGILIQGKNLILDGNTTVNGSFRVASGNITSLDAGKVTTGTLDAAKVSVVNLNASNIKTGTLSGVRIISTASGDTTEITGGNISSTGTITRIFGASSIATYVSTFDSYNGVVRVGITSKKSNGVERVDSAGGRATMLTDKGITTQRAVHSGTTDKNGARFIDFFADETLTSGVQGLGMHIFSGQSLRIEATQGITLTRASSSDNVLFVDGDMRARQAFVNTIQYNNDFSGTNIYVKPSAGGELRLTAANTTESYVDLRARQLFANTLQRNSGASGINIYIKPASGGEVRATLENTTDSYVPVRASSFPTASLAEYKQDIRPHTDSALAIINSATIYDYRLRSEVAQGKDRVRTGLVIGPGYNTPSCVVDGDGVEQYQMNSLSWLGIQELFGLYKALEVENFALKRRVAELEKVVYAA
ncbi:Phage endopeptidase [Niallia circulans]|uniref:phage tail spike protein n=9 Tax=Niallia circulans TaxID=1397 RepID=UPI00077CB68E|nr:phage tail spike protein [Niallia circulans]MED4242358.1 phage tail spike protein [Niallia circulans]MED4250460.1 phage tail spike protein [Niallia circulans]QKH59846.1 phage tail protein [Niallia circulans]SPT83326.1 Phage endopeptidase [Niallia circulans]